ncbi:ABC transporter ATP-binding protein [Archangium lansingense]|uniref:ABC transporter ATP-binding protein n=1 Tax=Archangium lansingense TaxID=2995310 RepID=A0ABT4ANY4_9BACT|nr:ABC transporter ATP-binding protein [Archangium lansinium]MCY1083398.1 ABC transporter ATP-binding protein [Archangium lansinium]
MDRLERTPPAIEARGLVKRFGGTVAVDALELRVEQGECMGLLGPNGAGKSTTLELLEGLQRPTAGTVRLFGLEWGKDAARVRARIGIAPQETRFHGKMTVSETLQLFRAFYPRGLPVDALLQLVGLEEKRGAYAMNLSGGQQHRLSLATALAGDPELLFLDEPTAGLDPRSRQALWDTLGSLKAQGRTVVLTTHYLEEARALCDRVVILDRGRIVAQGTPAKLLASLGGGQVIELVASPVPTPEVFADLPALRSLRLHSAGLTLHVAELQPALSGLLERVRARGLTLRSLSTREVTLDDVFLACTGHGLGEDTPS